jgi:hypothetical protein
MGWLVKALLACEGSVLQPDHLPPDMPLGTLDLAWEQLPAQVGARGGQGGGRGSMSCMQWPVVLT